MIISIAHINLTVPAGSLALADEFYGGTLQLVSLPVPELQRGTLAWYQIGPTPSQQVHISFGSTDPSSSRHPCFQLSSLEDLNQLREQIYEHHRRGGPAAPLEADEPGRVNSGAQGKEYPTRFFARDYAGNRLEFTL